MATQENSAALVPMDGEYLLEVKEFSQSGASSKFIVPIPNDLNSQQVSVMLRAALLKRTTWKLNDMPTIILAVLYADRMGLDILAGDVYMAEEGRMSTTAGAKIRHAMGTGRIRGYDVQITEGEAVTIPWKTSKESGEYKGPNLKAKVEVSVLNWDKPVVYETTLKEWFTGRNPNWRTRPAYMLRLNALSKALAEVAPMGVEPEEAPPLPEPPPSLAQLSAAALTSAAAAVTLDSSKATIDNRKGESNEQ